MSTGGFPDRQKKVVHMEKTRRGGAQGKMGVWRKSTRQVGRFGSLLEEIKGP